MRVFLVGRAKDRDRVRAELLDAGFEIVADSEAVTDTAAPPPPVDAIVTATAERTFRAGDVRTSDGTALGSAALDDSTALDVEPLTAREQDVLALLVEGLPNKAIAHALGISDQTVKFHVAAITGKLGAANRTDAVRRAIGRGLVAI